MTHTYEELKKKSVAELREMAAGMKHDAVQGYTQMNKEHLLVAICHALNLDTHLHHRKAAAGIDKAGIKQQIRALKQNRDSALQAHDASRLHDLRHQLHELKHQLRRAAEAQK